MTLPSKLLQAWVQKGQLRKALCDSRVLRQGVCRPVGIRSSGLRSDASGYSFLMRQSHGMDKADVFPCNVSPLPPSVYTAISNHSDAAIACRCCRKSHKIGGVYHVRLVIRNWGRYMDQKPVSVSFTFRGELGFQVQSGAKLAEDVCIVQEAYGYPSKKAAR